MHIPYAYGLKILFITIFLFLFLFFMEAVILRCSVPILQIYGIRYIVSYMRSACIYILSTIDT